MTIFGSFLDDLFLAILRVSESLGSLLMILAILAKMAKSGPKNGPKNGHFWDPKVSKMTKIWRFWRSTPYKKWRPLKKRVQFWTHFLTPFLRFSGNPGKSSTFANQIWVTSDRPKKGDQKVVQKWSKSGNPVFETFESFGNFGIFENSDRASVISFFNFGQNFHFFHVKKCVFWRQKVTFLGFCCQKSGFFC